jgi:hypothetical protein
MLIDYIQKNFHWAVIWGIILQCAGGLMSPIRSYALLAVLGWLIAVIGTVLSLAGFAFYSKSKNRSPLWCLLALLWIVGWFILILLKDKSSETSVKKRTCSTDKF